MSRRELISQSRKANITNITTGSSSTFVPLKLSSLPPFR